MASQNNIFTNDYCKFCFLEAQMSCNSFCYSNMHLGVTGQLQMTEKMRAGLSLINRTGTQCSKTTPNNQESNSSTQFQHVQNLPGNICGSPQNTWCKCSGLIASHSDSVTWFSAAQQILTANRQRPGEKERRVGERENSFHKSIMQGWTACNCEGVHSQGAVITATAWRLT